MIVGRDYQEKAVREVLPALWRAGKRAPILVSPVGSGKTMMAAMIAEMIRERDVADFWFMAHRIELIEQPYKLFTRLAIPAHKIISREVSTTTQRISDCRIASVQTLTNREIVRDHKVAVVVVDEAHRVLGAQYQELLKRFRSVYDLVYLVLLTATPYRLDGKPMSDVADALYEAASPQSLIDRKLIHDPVVLGLPEPDMRGVPKLAGDFVKTEVEKRINTDSLVGDVVESWLRYAGGRTTMLAAATIQHSKHLTERFADRGIRIAHLDGKTPKEERARILARLAIGGRGSTHPEALDIVSNVGILREGWDSESDYQRVLDDKTLWLGKSYPPEYVPLGVLSDCDPTDSCCLYRQTEGRVCRCHAKKDSALILSHSGNWQRHGFLTQHTGFVLGETYTLADRSKKRGSARGPLETFSRCGACLAVWPVGTAACASCGASFGHSGEPEAQMKETDAELTTVDAASTGVVFVNPNEQVEYARNLWKAYERKNIERRAVGKTPLKIGWVAQLFKARYGRWPSKTMLDNARRML